MPSPPRFRRRRSTTLLGDDDIPTSLFLERERERALVLECPRKRDTDRSLSRRRPALLGLQAACPSGTSFVVFIA
jgi:hypothetical protein